LEGIGGRRCGRRIELDAQWDRCCAMDKEVKGVKEVKMAARDIADSAIDLVKTHQE